jgi:hypothetical protein
MKFCPNERPGITAIAMLDNNRRPRSCTRHARSQHRRPENVDRHCNPQCPRNQSRAEAIDDVQRNGKMSM